MATAALFFGQHINANDSPNAIAIERQSHGIDISVTGIAQQTPRDFLNVLERAAQAGSADAALAIGNRYFQGKDVSKDLPNALQWWTQAAELGSAKAAYNLGVAYINGFGTTKNVAEAKNAFEQAAELHFPKALLALGILNLQTAESDEQTLIAGDYFRRAAEGGNAIAAKNLALMYEKGIGYAVDEKKAAYWRNYQQSTSKDDAPIAHLRPINSSAWVNSRNPENYTLQLVSGDTFEDTEKLISAVDSLDCAIFSKLLGKKTRFVAIAGDFANYTNASRALNGLPQDILKNEPFIVKFRVLQRQIDEHTKFNN